MNTIKNFFSALNTEEDKVRQILSKDNLGLLLRAAINELDLYDYNMRNTGDTTPEQEEHHYIYTIGTTRLIQLSLESRSSFEVPTITFCRDKSTSIKTLELVMKLGFIEHGRRVAQTVSAGIGSIKQSTIDTFTITLPDVIADEEYYEKTIASHYKKQTKANYLQALNSKHGRKTAKQVRRLLKKLVHPFKNHFIGYGANPLLDIYFFGIAYNEIQSSEGYDTFHYSTKFGGISFQKYMLSLIYFISISIRHEQFARALIEKCPTVKLENILTISSSKIDFIESISLATNYFGSFYENFEKTTYEEASQIFETLSYSRKNLPLLSAPGSPLPFFIQCSDHDFIRCLTGAYSTPVQFLLNSLRHHFPRDYDKNQTTREESMQTALKRIFNAGIKNLSFLENVKIRSDNKISTDIDLVIIEETTGSIFLCQLKHQEIYGADLHSKKIRSDRLREQSARWLDVVMAWLKNSGENGIKATLQLPSTFMTPNIYRVIISKHYSHPLKSLNLDADTLHSNWPCLFNAIEILKSFPSTDRNLTNLAITIKDLDYAGNNQTYASEPETSWHINNLKFTIQHKNTNQTTEQPRQT
jgi:hypothetical protein